MIQQIIRSGLAFALVSGLGGCGDGTGEFGQRDPLAVNVPTVVAPPAINPVLEFPLRVAWQAYYFDIDSSSRIQGESGMPIDRWAAPRPGQAIADVGAGGGYYTFRYAPLVGPQGLIHALDLDWYAAHKIAWEAQQRGASNVLVTQVPDGELGLEKLRFDTVLMISTGILLTCDSQRAQSYLAQVARALRPGGQLLYIDPLSAPGLPGAASCPATSGLSVVERAAPYFLVEEQVDMAGMMGGLTGVAIRFRLRSGS
jgi:SAM-dependent methyltransferase